MPRRSAVVALLLSACSSDPPPAPTADAPSLDAAETAPCGGACGPGTVCELGRCVAVIGPDAAPDVGGDAVLEVGSDAAAEASADAPVPDACVSSDPMNCCGIWCRSGRHAGTPTCTRGVCGTVCDPNFGDCDGDADNGCEADLRGDFANCGACGARCGNGQVCNGSMCVARCESGANCSGSCRNLQIDPTNCGACGVACAPRPHAAPDACIGRGVCSYRCDDGFRDCNGVVADGCEANADSDPNNCGVCGQRCADGHRCFRRACH